MAGIKDVAREAGVAVSTVSKVLNNYPNVSNETREKVNKAIKKLDFMPNAVAAALSSKQPGRVAILINQAANASIDEVDMQYLSGAILKAREQKLDVITLFFSMIADKSLKEITTYLKSQNVEALIIFGLSKDDKAILKLVESGEFKAVCVDAPLVSEHSSCVWVDQY
ncbi:MAG: LacI family DNA-binding transcriptional regulator, partial [Lachnospiraceae bacterium]|nr:LacI family DNA-binding transcriptional regulator [Lachnospiraceae bacterium]